MGDIVEMIRHDHNQLSRNLTAIEAGNVTAIPSLCALLRSHSRIEQELLFPAVVDASPSTESELTGLRRHDDLLIALMFALESAQDITQEYLATAARLVSATRDHVTASEPFLLNADREMSVTARAELADRAQVLRSVMDDVRYSTSDGDSSWIQSPLTQDPTVDRSVDATIARSPDRSSLTSDGSVRPSPGT